MTKNKKYTISDLKRETINKQTNWLKKLQIARLVNQGVSYAEVGRRLIPTMSRAGVRQSYLKIANMSIEELEENTKKYQDHYDIAHGN